MGHFIYTNYTTQKGKKQEAALMQEKARSAVNAEQAVFLNLRPIIIIGFPLQFIFFPRHTDQLFLIVTVYAPLFFSPISMESPVSTVCLPLPSYQRKPEMFPLIISPELYILS